MRQGSFGRERSLSSPKTPTDARTKRRLNTLLNKAGMIPKTVSAPKDDVDSGVTTVRLEYKRRLQEVFEQFNPEKIENVPAILAKHGNNLHSIYMKVCKKYDKVGEPEYTGPSKIELEEAIDRLTIELRSAKISQHEFQFHLEEALDAGEQLMMAQTELQERNTNLENMIESARQAAGEQSALQQARMQGEINGLMQENKRLGKDKVNLYQMKHDLEDRINELMGERDKDGDLILKLNDDIEKMKQRIRELENESQKMKEDHLDTLETTKTRLTRQLTWAKQTADEDRSLYETQVKEMNEEAANTIEGLKSELENYKDQLEAEQEDNRKLGKHKVELLQVRKDLKEKVSMLESEREADGDLILKLNDDIEKYKMKVNEMDDELADLQSTYDRTVHKNRITLEKTKNDYEGRLQDLADAKLDEKVHFEGEIQKLSSELAETKAASEDDISRLENLVRNVREQGKRKLEDANQRHEMELGLKEDEKRAERKRLDGEIQSVQKEMDNAIKMFEDQIRELEQESDMEKRRLNKQLKETITSYEDQLSNLREEKVGMRIDLEGRIQHKQDELTQTMARYEEQVGELESDHDLYVRKANRDMMNTKKDYEHQLSDLRDKMVAERMKLEGNIDNLQLLKKNLEGKIKHLETERDKDGDLILRLNDDCERYKKKISNLEFQVSELDGHLEDTKARHERAMMKHEQKMKDTLHLHDRTMNETKKSLTRQMTFIEEQAKEEQTRLKGSLEEKHVHGEERARAMNAKIHELTEQLEVERTDNGKKVAAYSILKQKFDNQEVEMANMMDDLISKTNKIRNLEKLTRDKGNAEPNEAHARQARLQSLRVQELELEIERLNRTQKSSNSELEETCKLFQRDLKNQKAINQQLQREKDDLYSQLNSAGADSAVVHHLQSELNETKRKYEQSNETVIRLDEALRGALAKQDDFTSKITELKGEIGRLQQKTNRAESFISETTCE